MFLRQKSIYEPETHKIIDRVDFTKDTFMLRVASKANPQPGQFLMVSLPGYGEAAFSTASFNENIIELIIKKAGSVTTQLSKLKPKDSILLRGPYGHGYPLKELENKSFTIVATGVGVVSARALIQSVLRKKGKFGNLNLYFSFKSFSDMIIKNDLDKWKSIYNLKVILESPDKGWGGDVGPIGPFLENEKHDLTSSIILSGPSQMIRSSIGILQMHGFRDNQIYMHLERKMQCGIGKCGTCMIGGEYCCKDGPVFRYDKIKKNKEW